MFLYVRRYQQFMGLKKPARALHPSSRTSSQRRAASIPFDTSWTWWPYRGGVLIAIPRLDTHHVLEPLPHTLRTKNSTLPTYRNPQIFYFRDSDHTRALLLSLLSLLCREGLRKASKPTPTPHIYKVQLILLTRLHLRTYNNVCFSFTRRVGRRFVW